MITCECGEKMKRYEQPIRFGQSFTFWKCEKCGKFLREEIESGRVKTNQEDQVKDNQDS
jgi:RNase P subunit RPR2